MTLDEMYAKKAYINEVTEESLKEKQKLMVYRGFVGSVEYSEEDTVFFGRVLRIRSLVSYEGRTKEELEEDFHNAVDEYVILKKS